MYDISVALADENGLIDTRTEKVGIRTVLWHIKKAPQRMMGSILRLTANRSL